MDKDFLIKEVKVENKYGLHARPAALIAQTAGKYECDIFIEKSIIGLMTIEGYPGSILELSVIGKDAEEALEALVALFANKFNED